jgi:hypothetical protein
MLETTPTRKQPRSNRLGIAFDAIPSEHFDSMIFLKSANDNYADIPTLDIVQLIIATLDTRQHYFNRHV